MIFDWIGSLSGSYKKAADIYDLMDTPRYPDYPCVIAFEGNEETVRHKMHGMLLACLSGGMSYQDAKDAVSLEFKEELLRAKESDSNAKACNTRNREEYEQKLREYWEYTKRDRPWLKQDEK